MREVQASEAKAYFHRLLDDVERGETVLITRHGRPIARLVPERHRREAEAGRAIDRIQQRRLTAKPATTQEILEWRREGQRG